MATTHPHTAICPVCYHTIRMHEGRLVAHVDADWATNERRLLPPVPCAGSGRALHHQHA